MTTHCFLFKKFQGQQKKLYHVGYVRMHPFTESQKDYPF
jgi:hypothetical protein